MKHCRGVLRFITYNEDINERKCGGNKFKNLAPAGFQHGTYGTTSHHAIRP